MEYREKEWLRTGKKYTVQQKWIPLSRISPYLINAVLIAEDDKFWNHKGFDFEAIQNALERDVQEKKLKFGASTVSQQLVKNLYLSPEKSLFRKISEAVITWRLEKTLSKRRILELYLNLVEWGNGGIFGIEMASRHYYGKSASDLNPSEASRLAVILPNPRKYNPLGDSTYIKRRADIILRVMQKRGIVASEVERGMSDNLENIHTEIINNQENMREDPESSEGNNNAETEDLKQ